MICTASSASSAPTSPVDTPSVASCRRVTCTRCPTPWPIEQAATFPTCFLTASHALFAVAELRAGETVLIHAAGSGVSVAAIQLAVDAGATVLATAGSTEKLRTGDSNSAPTTCSTTAPATSLRGLARSPTVVASTWCSITSAPRCSQPRSSRSRSAAGWCHAATPAATRRPSRVSGSSSTRGSKILGSDPYRPEEFGPTWERFCVGDFAHTVDAEYALADAAEAQARLEAGDVFGKIVLRP